MCTCTWFQDKWRIRSNHKLFTRNTRWNQQKRGAMCQPDCVATVKELMAELCCAKNQLVERLNVINDQIKKETDPLSKELLIKVEWMAEKKRSVEPLQKVSPFPLFFPPSSNNEHPDGHQLITHLPTSEQIAASLQGALEADEMDSMSAEVTPVASGQDCWAEGRDEESGFTSPADGIPDTSKGELCQVRSPAITDIDVSGRASSTAASPPNRTASMERLQTELFALTMKCVDDGCVRECSVLPPPFPWVLFSLPLHDGKPAARPPNYHSEEDDTGQECSASEEGTSAPDACAQVPARDQEGAANFVEEARDQPMNRTASVARMQAELFALTMERIDEGEANTP